MFGGLILLILGAELLVRSASRIAALLHVPRLLIGLTIVAFGTSAPELAVGVKAGLAGQADLAVGNVVGSNIFNVLFILGVSAIITPLAVAHRLVRLDVPVMIGVTALAWFLARDGRLGQYEGIFLVWLMAPYLLGQALLYRPVGPGNETTSFPSKQSRNGVVVVWATYGAGIILGLLLLVWGSRGFLGGAAGIARSLGVGELVIGLTLVAAGTSLPEAAASIVAALRGERDIAVGNIIGSNIFNVLCVLAVSGMVTPGGLTFSMDTLAFDLPVMMAATVICLPIFVTGAAISRLEGWCFLIYYGLYTLLLILRATGSDRLPMAADVLQYGVLPATGLLLLFSLLRAYGEIRILANTMMDDISFIGGYALRNARKTLVLMVGLTLLLIGVGMMVLPGPATLVIPLALAILGTEFLWARRLLKLFYEKAREAAQHLAGKPPSG